MTASLPRTIDNGLKSDCPSAPDAPDVGAHLAYAFQQAPSFFAILKGPDFVFEAVNDAYYQIVGHREIVGKTLLDALPEVEAQGSLENLKRVMETGIPYFGREVHVKLQRAPGEALEERIVDFTYLPLMESGEAPTGVIATGQDVTESVHAREALEKARDRAERLYSFTTELSLAQTLVAVADAVIAGTKGAFPESVGTIIARKTVDLEDLELLAVSELPGQIFENWQRFPLSTAAPLTDAVRTCEPILLESPNEWEQRYPDLLHLLTDTGHRAQIVAPLVVAGEAIGAIGIAFATDKKFSEDDKNLAVSLAQQCAVAMERARLFDFEQTARNAAETASRFKSEFLAGISHELRTPLNAIGGYAELLEMGIHGPVTEEQRIALDRIQASRKHVQGLIDSVLELSRIEAGATRYAIEPVLLGEAVSVCEALTAPQMRAKGQQYSRSGNLEELVVLADAEKLRQIILNLLANAVKYSGAGAAISLSVERIANRVSLKISDTGRGIDAAQLELIFQPFVQLGSTFGTQSGVGLGLAISRNLARGMGGDLTVASEVGKGSTFTLTLPTLD